MKKAQIQIFETIAVLLVFFILIAVGIVFYGRVIKGNLESEKEGLEQRRSVVIAQRAMFMPELQCSEDNYVTENCIDILKFEAAKDIIQSNTLYYFDLFEYGEINLTILYPEYSNINLYSRDNAKMKEALPTRVPISVYNATSNSYYFGVLTIKTLIK